MIAIYRTEEEQLEALRNWFKKHSKFIAMIISISLFLILSFKYWQWHEYKIKVVASENYEKLIEAVTNQNNQQIKAYANQLINEYPHLIYTDAAYLILAKVLVAEKNYAKVIEQLQQVVTYSKQKSLQQIARLRIVRVLILQRKLDLAMQELSLIIDATYLPFIEELQGDIYMLQSQYSKALEEYTKASSSFKKANLHNAFLEVKLNSIKV